MKFDCTGTITTLGKYVKIPLVQLMKKKAGPYIPALSHDWLTPLYDSIIRWTMPEYAFKHRLIGQARITAGQRVLDLGCGTGTLTLFIRCSLRQFAKHRIKEFKED